MRLLRAFVSEYGRYSATKTVWTAFATVFLLQLIFNGMVIEAASWTWEISFSGTNCAAVLGAIGAIYAWRRASECKHGRADEKGKADAA